jgi:hypothetical protein
VVRDDHPVIAIAVVDVQRLHRVHVALVHEDLVVFRRLAAQALQWRVIQVGGFVTAKCAGH